MKLPHRTKRITKWGDEHSDVFHYQRRTAIEVMVSSRLCRPALEESVTIGLL
jgi:hypothetical protein